MQVHLPLSLFIALRYSRSGKNNKFASFVALISTVGIAIGVIALIVVSSIMQGLENKLKNSILSETPHIVLECKEADLESLLKLPHVLYATPYLSFDVIAKSNSEIAVLSLHGIDPSKWYISDKASNFSFNFLNPGLDKVNPKKFEIIIDKETRVKLKLFTNDKINIISTKNARFTPFGITPITRNFTIVGTSMAPMTGQTLNAYTHIRDLMSLLRQKGEYYSYRLYLDDPYAYKEVTQYLDNKYQYNDWTSLKGDFFKAVALEKLSMTTMLFLIIIVAAFNILSSLSMMVSSKLKEIAILKTIGFKDSKILQIFMIMGLSSGVIGAVIGVILGIPLAYNATILLKILNINIISNLDSLPIEVNFINVAIIFIATLLLSLLCTIYPALKASKAYPVEYLN